MITHSGQEIPRDPTSFDPDNKEWITFVWDDQVSLRGSIQTSQWIIPDDWVEEDDRQDVPVETESGSSFNHANQVLLTTDTTRKNIVVTITNRVEFADSTQLDRSVKLVVDSQ